MKKKKSKFYINNNLDFYDKRTNSNIVEIGPNITQFAYRGLDSCNKLQELIIGPNVKNIHTMSIYKCNALRKLIMPDNIQEIYYKGISDCINLRYITLSSNLKYIHPYAFNQCGFTHIQLGNGEILYQAQYHMNELSEASIFSTINYIYGKHVCDSDFDEILAFVNGIFTISIGESAMQKYYANILDLANNTEAKMEMMNYLYQHNIPVGNIDDLSLEEGL